jgi:hypothetical protein
MRWPGCELPPSAAVATIAVAANAIAITKQVGIQLPLGPLLPDGVCAWLVVELKRRVPMADGVFRTRRR